MGGSGGHGLNGHFGIRLKLDRETGGERRTEQRNLRDQASSDSAHSGRVPVREGTKDVRVAVSMRRTLGEVWRLCQVEAWRCIIGRAYVLH